MQIVDFVEEGIADIVDCSGSLFVVGGLRIVAVDMATVPAQTDFADIIDFDERKIT